jgi:cytochrome P450
VFRLQLELIFAAIHTTTMTATNVLYTLATTPEYIDLLRDEIRNVMANHDGYITSQGLQQMEKLDSYMKEVVRCYPTNISTCPTPSLPMVRY